MKSLVLRTLSVTVALGAALCAQASFVYKFSGRDISNPVVVDLTLTSSSLITSSSTILAANLDSYSLGAGFEGQQLVSVDFLPSSTAGSTLAHDVVRVNTTGATTRSNYWYFETGSFQTLGQSQGVESNGRLTVEAVPEPSMITVLGLGLAGFCKRNRIRR